MVDNDRLWYEVSVVSPAIEEILRANRDLDIGECTNSWCASDLLGHDAFLGLTQQGQAPSEPLSRVASQIGQAGLGELFRVADLIVGKIDGAGWANFGPGVEAAEHVPTTATVIPRPSRSAILGTGAVPAGLPRAAMVAKSLVERVNIESVSVRNVLAGEAPQDEFW
jgi:hypothetical protein